MVVATSEILHEDVTLAGASAAAPVTTHDRQSNTDINTHTHTLKDDDDDDNRDLILWPFFCCSIGIARKDELAQYYSHSNQ